MRVISRCAQKKGTTTKKQNFSSTHELFNLARFGTADRIRVRNRTRGSPRGQPRPLSLAAHVCHEGRNRAFFFRWSGGVRNSALKNFPRWSWTPEHVPRPHLRQRFSPLTEGGGRGGKSIRRTPKRTRTPCSYTAPALKDSRDASFQVFGRECTEPERSR